MFGLFAMVAAWLRDERLSAKKREEARVMSDKLSAMSPEERTALIKRLMVQALAEGEGEEWKAEYLAMDDAGKNAFVAQMVEEVHFGLLIRSAV